IVDGTLRQTATPTELVARPADPFVATFTGANVLHGRAEGSGHVTLVQLPDGTRITTVEPGHGEVVLAIYPWDVTISAHRPDASARNVTRGPVQSIVELGNRVRITVGPISAEITGESLERLGLRLGQDAFASFKATGTRVVASN